MNRILTWREVAPFLSRKAKRYSSYLKSVLQVRVKFPDPLPAEQVNEQNRRIVLDSVFRWVIRNHAHQRSVHEIDIRAVAWLLRFTWPHHPVFENINVDREHVFDALNWQVDDVFFQLQPEGSSGVILAATVDNFTWYFDPLFMIAPGIEEDGRVPFSLRMGARRVMEHAFRVACTLGEACTIDDVDDIAIRTAADQLLKVVAPLVASDDDED